jgi:hypothetical protein
LQVVRGRFPADDAPSHGDEEAKDFAVEGVIVPFTLGKNPSRLAGPPVPHAQLGVELFGILGGGVSRE